MTTPNFDPADHTVDEVNSYLADNPGDRGAVLAAERDGRGRTGILDGPHGGDDTDDNAPDPATAPLAATDEVLEQGYIGFSPERERTGLDDKGLSQATPSVMDASLTPVDARPNVDDSDALKGR